MNVEKFTKNSNDAIGCSPLMRILYTEVSPNTSFQKKTKDSIKTSFSHVPKNRINWGPTVELKHPGMVHRRSSFFTNAFL